jgi:hypothetical protein
VQAPAAVSQRLTEFMKGKRHIARSDLLRYDDIHQPGQKGHGHEDDHDGAVGAEDLIEVFGRQITLRRPRGKGLLRAHQDGIGKSRAAA